MKDLKKVLALVVCLCFFASCVSFAVDETLFNESFSDFNLEEEIANGYTNNLYDLTLSPNISVKTVGDATNKELEVTNKQTNNQGAVFALKQPVTVLDGDIYFSFKYKAKADTRRPSVTIYGTSNHSATTGAMNLNLLETDNEGDMYTYGLGGGRTDGNYATDRKKKVISKEERAADGLTEELEEYEFEYRLYLAPNDNPYYRKMLMDVKVKKPSGGWEIICEAMPAGDKAYADSNSQRCPAKQIEGIKFGFNYNNDINPGIYYLDDIAIRQPKLEVVETNNVTNARGVNIKFNGQVDLETVKNSISVKNGDVAFNDYTVTSIDEKTVYVGGLTGFEKTYTVTVGDGVNRGKETGALKPSKGYTYSVNVTTPSYTAKKVYNENFDRYDIDTGAKETSVFTVTDAAGAVNTAAGAGLTTVQASGDGNNKALNLAIIPGSNKKAGFDFALPEAADLRSQKLTVEFRMKEDVYEHGKFTYFFPSIGGVNFGYGNGAVYLNTHTSAKMFTETERSDAKGKYTDFRFEFRKYLSTPKVTVYRKLDGATDYTMLYELSGDSMPTALTDTISNITFAITAVAGSTQTGTANYWLDDLKVTVEEIPIPSAPVYSVESNSITMGMNIPVLADTVNSDNIVLKRVVDQEELLVENSTISLSGNDIVIGLSESLENGADYKIYVKDIESNDVSRTKLDDEKVYTFRVQNPVAISGTSASYDSVANNVSVSAKIAKTGALGAKYAAIAVLRSRDTNVVVDAVSVQGEVKTDEPTPISFENFAVPAEFDKAAYDVTIYVWSGFTKAVPLCGVTDIAPIE